MSYISGLLKSVSIPLPHGIHPVYLCCAKVGILCAPFLLLSILTQRTSFLLAPPLGHFLSLGLFSLELNFPG